VSAPCTWDEIERGAVPATFTLRNMAARIDEIGDLWGDMKRRRRSAGPRRKLQRLRDGLVNHPLIPGVVPVSPEQPAPNYVNGACMLQDLRTALRVISRDRWLTAAAVTALALGIGVNATVFTLVNAVLIKGLPFPQSHNLYILGIRNMTQPRGSGSAVPAGASPLARAIARVFRYRGFSRRR
jgi:hypothetical protein